MRYRNSLRGREAVRQVGQVAAAANLAYAFHTTPARFHRHRRIILTLLIPAKLACCLAKQSEGAFPSARLLHKYNLPELAQLVAAFQVGAGPPPSESLGTRPQHLRSGGLGR